MPPQVPIMRLEVPMWQIFAPAFLAFVLGILAAPLYQLLISLLFRPRLNVEFDPKDKTYVPLTEINWKEGKQKAKYIRIGVTNTARFGTAKDCRVYLTDLYKIQPNGALGEQLYADALRLCYAYEDEDGVLHEGIDIHRGVRFCFDIARATENDEPEIRFANPGDITKSCG